MDVDEWNGGTKPATRATLIFVHVEHCVEDLPLSVVRDACGFTEKTRDKILGSSSKNVGLIEHTWGSQQTRLDKAQSLPGDGQFYRRWTTIHIEFLKCYA